MKIVNKSAFEEAQFMAMMALWKKSKRVKPESYWDAAIAALREAYYG